MYVCMYDSFIHSFSSLSRDRSIKPLPKWAVHIVRSRASSFRWEYPFLSLRSSSSFLRLLPRHPVPCISPFIFRSITCCRRQFLRKMWPIQSAFRYVWYVLLNATQATGVRNWSFICVWCSVELINNFTLRISEFIWHLLAIHVKGKTSIEHEKGSSVRVT
jgi:hypothetical protein